MKGYFVETETRRTRLPSRPRSHSTRETTQKRSEELPSFESFRRTNGPVDCFRIPGCGWLFSRFVMLSLQYDMAAPMEVRLTASDLTSLISMCRLTQRRRATMSWLLITMVIFAAASVNAKTSSPSGLFRSFEREYNKIYPTSEERAHRFQIFLETLKRIDQLNENEPFRPHGINEFADLTPAEFRLRYLMTSEDMLRIQSLLDNVPELELPSHVDLPEEFDWRNNGSFVTPVKNQKQCGSCWAFSVTENVESVWAIAGNELVELAPQQIVDCDTKDNGCSGGDTIHAYEYVIAAGGLELEAVSYL
jgi:hypothetical protein